MKRTWIAVVSAALVAACVPESKDGGEIEDTSESSVDTMDDGSGSSGGESSGQSSSQTGGQTGGQTTLPPTSATTGESESAVTTATDSETGTTGGTDQACVDLGWDVAFNTWSTDVEAAGGNYHYVVVTYEYIDGFTPTCSYESAIRVEQGVVVERDFRLAMGDEETCQQQEFEEAGDQVGENDNPFAADPLLLEDVYVDCCQNHLTLPPEDYNLNFEVDESGYMTHCSAVNANCLDVGCEHDEAGYITIVEQTVG